MLEVVLYIWEGGLWTEINIYSSSQRNPLRTVKIFLANVAAEVAILYGTTHCIIGWGGGAFEQLLTDQAQILRFGCIRLLFIFDTTIFHLLEVRIHCTLHGSEITDNPSKIIHLTMQHFHIILTDAAACRIKLVQQNETRNQSTFGEENTENVSQYWWERDDDKLHHELQINMAMPYITDINNNTRQAGWLKAAG